MTTKSREKEEDSGHSSRRRIRARMGQKRGKGQARKGSEDGPTIQEVKDMPDKGERKGRKRGMDRQRKGDHEDGLDKYKGNGNRWSR